VDSAEHKVQPVIAGNTCSIDRERVWVCKLPVNYFPVILLPGLKMVI
jgi:hypothetical protein